MVTNVVISASVPYAPLFPPRLGFPSILLSEIETFQRVALTPQPKFLSLLPDGKKGVADR